MIGSRSLVFLFYFFILEGVPPFESTPEPIPHWLKEDGYNWKQVATTPCTLPPLLNYNTLYTTTCLRFDIDIAEKEESETVDMMKKTSSQPLKPKITQKEVDRLAYPPSRIPPSHAKVCDARYVYLTLKCQSLWSQICLSNPHMTMSMKPGMSVCVGSMPLITNYFLMLYFYDTIFCPYLFPF